MDWSTLKIMIKKVFLLCHIRHINLVEEDPGRIKKTDRRIASNLIIKELNFLYKKKIFKRSKYKITVVLMCLVMKMS